jgi:hypothetical protein
MKKDKENKQSAGEAPEKMARNEQSKQAQQGAGAKPASQAQQGGGARAPNADVQRAAKRSRAMAVSSSPDEEEGRAEFYDPAIEDDLPRGSERRQNENK